MIIRPGAGSLLVVTGPPGAGKSTVARLLADEVGPSVLVEGDAFFAFLARDAVPPWLPDSNAQNAVVTEVAATATGRFVSGGYRTIYDGIVGPWFLPSFATATGLTELDYVVLMPTLDACLERVLTRRDHGFRDEGATRKMYEEFAAAEVDARHVLALGTETAEQVAARIGEAASAGGLQIDVAPG